MSPIGPQDSIGEFTLELIRTGSMLFGVAADLADELPADSYPGEEPGAVVIEMMTGTIRTALSEIDEQMLEEATDLMVLARERVLEHLQLALELSRRHERGTGRQQG
jgi:hypothetical protein